MPKVIPHLILVLLFFSCSHKITTNIQNKMDASFAPADIIVLPINSEKPEGDFIGSVKLGDTGFSTNCTYNDAIEKARIQASKAGGNLIRITEHKGPNFGSSCDRITAEIFRATDEFLTQFDVETLGDVEYALLHVYRPKSFGGAAISYNLYFDDSLICRVKNNFKKTIKLEKEGPNIIWSRTESRMEIPIDVEFGKEYYLSCTVDYGAMVGRPDFQLVSRQIGKEQFQQVEGRR